MDLEHFSREIRLKALDLCYLKKTSHIGGAFSVAEILAVLYGSVMNISPSNAASPDRDRLFYSKGHACTALYAALDISGFFPGHDLDEEFIANGSYFTSHVNHRLPGIELSTGSLGHALGVACGSALACKRKNVDSSIFAILSDGELDEGSNWEAIMFAAHNRLDNLIAIIDYNKIQSFGNTKDVMNLEPLAEKFRSFNWEIQEVDGHSIKDLDQLLWKFKSERADKPKCVLAHTIKGKGVSFMEQKLLWHYRSPTLDEVECARSELMEAS